MCKDEEENYLKYGEPDGKCYTIQSKRHYVGSEKGGN